MQKVYAKEKSIITKTDIENVKFDIDTAIPLGLIVNELVTNAFKYAFTKDSENILYISITHKSNTDYLLIIKDNGPGLPENMDISKTISLGLKLARRLTKQLQGTLSHTNENGSVFSITFKDTLQRKDTE